MTAFVCAEMAGVRIDVVRARIDVHKDRTRSDVVNRAARREEGEGRGDHLVAVADAQRAQRQQNGIGSVGAAHRELDLGQPRDAALELRDRIAQNERLLVDDLHERGHDFVADRGVLCLQVEKRYGHNYLPIKCSRAAGGAHRAPSSPTRRYRE